MNLQGEIGVGKTYGFALAYSGYAMFVIKTNFHSLVMIVLCIIFATLSYFFYKISRGWKVATILPLPFLFLTAGVMFTNAVGLNHYLTLAAGSLAVLSIMALTAFTMIHNVSVSQQNDR